YSNQKFSRWNQRIIWEWPSEIHLDENNEPTSSYFKWRQAGFENKDAVRYPVGFNYRHNCEFSLTDDGRRLDYIEARKEIYLKLYMDLVKEEPLFKELKDRI